MSDIFTNIKRFGSDQINKFDRAVDKFNTLPGKGQFKIIAKTLLVAFAAGIIANLVCPLISMPVFVVSGLAAFRYFTDQYNYSITKEIVQGMIDPWPNSKGKGIIQDIIRPLGDN